MKKGIVFLCSVVFFSGCVSTKNASVPTDMLRNMRGKSLVITSSEKPDFTAMTAALAMLGGAGVYQMIEDGNKLVERNAIDDPALSIGQNLANMMHTKRHLNITSKKVLINKEDKVDILVDKYKSVDYILDVRTVKWAFSHYPLDWDNYRIIYSAKMRFIDVHHKKIVAEGYCNIVPSQTDESPSYDDLFKNKAQIIKNRLKSASTECLKNFYKQL